MKSVFLIATSLIFLVLGDSVRANSIDAVRSAQRIVVLDDSEGIVYAHFCGFYELRKIIAEGLLGPKGDETEASNPMFEIRVLGRSGESKVFVGDHWIRSKDGVSSLSAAVFERFVELVSSRKGHGIPLSTVDAANARAVRKFKRPEYKQDDRCSS